MKLFPDFTGKQAAVYLGTIFVASYDGVCDCDLVYHVHCCPDCAGED